VLRSRRRSIESPQNDELGETAHPAVDIEARDAALKLLGTLSEQEMQIAVLLFVDGMSQGEIAEEVGISRVTVNKKIQALRARAERYARRAS
jgi:RNA polymerase sigma factor (sigma-70 family)